MAKILKLTAFLSAAATVCFSVLYNAVLSEILLSLAITFGTITYHFAMRLLVGLLFHSVMQNKADYTKKCYQVSRSEMTIYEKLHVKSWKRRMPTYNPEIFDPRIHSWNEIAQATCQAELVHKTIAVLSFLPITAGVWFGAYPVFIITSVLAAACDMMFVIMQRYNRQQLMRLLYRESRQNI